MRSVCAEMTARRSPSYDRFPMEHLAIALLDSSNAMLVLMLVSLGLAIVFGLMNVINMAHGEFLMLGAYALMSLTGHGLPFWLA